MNLGKSLAIEPRRRPELRLRLKPRRRLDMLAFCGLLNEPAFKGRSTEPHCCWTQVLRLKVRYESRLIYKPCHAIELEGNGSIDERATVVEVLVANWNFIFEISNLNYPGIYVHVAYNLLGGL